ncbi:MAG TPA: hypothetical protein VI389_12365 [Geobacteraceae bacterium]
MAGVRFLTILRNKFGLLALCAFVLTVSGCYHMRFTPAPLDTVEFVVPKPKEDLFSRAEGLLADDGFSVVRRDPDAGMIETDYHFFYKETGAQQPIEGRDYYYRLRVRLEDAPGGTRVRVEVAALELRTHYVYDENGGINQLTKRYPYENYPSMFDLTLVSRELRRVGQIFRRSLL